MAGHQWSKVERQPGALDAKCGKLDPKLAGTFTLALDPGMAAAKVFAAAAPDFRVRVDHDFPESGIERTGRNSVPMIGCLGHCSFESPLKSGVASTPSGKELHFHNTSRGHLHSVGDSLYEAYRGPDSTTLTGLHPTAGSLRTDKAAAQSSRFSAAPGGNDDVHYVHANTDIAEQPLVKIGG